MNPSSQYPHRRRLTRAEARRRRRNRAIRRVAGLTLVACVLVGGVSFLLHRKAPVPAASAASALPAASSTAASEAATNGLFLNVIGMLVFMVFGLVASHFYYAVQTDSPEIIAYGTWGELLPIIAMALLLSTRATWQTVVILLAFLAIAVAAAAVPKIAERIGGYVHRFIVANANTNTQMVIRSVNLLLIGLTAVSAVFDLDIVLGAFAAGFILRYLIPTGDQTMEMKHNAIAYGFLVPLFFVVSGAKVDVRAIGAQPELLVLFILLLLFVRALPIFVGLSTGRSLGWASVKKSLVSMLAVSMVARGRADLSGSMAAASTTMSASILICSFMMRSEA